MGFVSHSNVSQHCCFAPDALAFSLHVLHQSVSTPRLPVDGARLHSTAPGDPPLSIDELSKWRLSSVSEWQSTCKNPGWSSQACHCSATHVCGPYFVVELSRRCGCYRSIQVRANGHTERFVFLDSDLPFDSGAGSGIDVRVENIPDNTSSELGFMSTTSHRAIISSPAIPSSFKTTESFIIKDVFSPLFSRSFSLVDLAFLLGAIKHEHAEHRWTDAYADRSLMDFSIPEVFVFLRYYFEGDLRHQVKEHRRSIAKTFYDWRVDTWNLWIPCVTPDTYLSPRFSNIRTTERIEEEMGAIDHERQLLSCMKERVSFVSDHLRLLWVSIAAQQCALKASLQFVMNDED